MDKMCLKVKCVNSPYDFRVTGLKVKVSKYTIKQQYKKKMCVKYVVSHRLVSS